MMTDMKSQSSRISVMIDRELAGNLREMQADMIKKVKRNVSFSEVVNLILKEGLKSKR